MSATTTRSRVSHGSVDAVAFAVLREPLVDPVGEPEQRELAQRGEVARPEVVARAPRRSAPAGRRCRAPSARRSASRRHVDELDLVGRAHDLVGDRLALLDAGDLLDDVVQRLEVLDVDRRDDVDAGVEQLLDVLPALLVARAGDVGVRELVDERDLRAAARARRRRPSPRTSRRGTRRPLRGTTSRSPTCSAVLRAAVRLDEADDDVARRARGDAGPRPASRTSCRRRARRRGRRGASPRAMRAYRLTPASSSARLSSSTLTRGSPRKPSERPSCVVVDERAAPGRGRVPRASATRGACSRAFAGEMCGSRPEPEAVTASTGTSRPARGRSRAR